MSSVDNWRAAAAPPIRATLRRYVAMIHKEPILLKKSVETAAQR
jgi:hypothetical protein